MLFQSTVLTEYAVENALCLEKKKKKSNWCLKSDKYINELDSLKITWTAASFLRFIMIMSQYGKESYIYTTICKIKLLVTTSSNALWHLQQKMANDNSFQRQKLLLFYAE